MKLRQIVPRVCAPLLAAALVLAMAQGSAVSSVPTLKKVRPLTAVEPIRTGRFDSSDSFAGYTPAQIRKAYGLDKLTGTGSGQTIAIVESYGDPTLQSDLSEFDTKYGLPAADLTVLSVGSPSGGADSSDLEGWAEETAMDVEWAHAMAPGAKLLVYTTLSEDSDQLLAAMDEASASGAGVVSMSWGTSESGDSSYYDSHFASGIAYVASAGDDGAENIWPAASPKVIAVGGTTLNLTSSGARRSEYGWYLSGGGISRVEAEPSWQSAMGLLAFYRIRMFRRNPSVSGRRLIPDVSFDADPDTGVSVYCSYAQSDSNTEQPGWFVIGGTSLGAPCWGGVIAVLDSSGERVAGASSLYTAAGGSAYTNSKHAFYDVVGGFNGYAATPGYDLVTGLGSPQANQLAAALQSVSPSAAKTAKGSTAPGSTAAKAAARRR